MKKFDSVLMLFFCFVIPVFSAEPAPPATPIIKPGRYILIMHGEPSHSPDPIIVQVKAVADGLTIEPESGSKGAITMQSEGNSLVFMMTTTMGRGIPPKDQDWPVEHIFTFCGAVSENRLEGPFSDLSPYYHPSSPAVLETGTFLLYSLDAK